MDHHKDVEIAHIQQKKQKLFIFSTENIYANEHFGTLRILLSKIFPTPFRTEK